MASTAYTEWINAGRPYTLILPARHLQKNIRVYGLTVYDYPNDTHLKANKPEDHTPFSVTGWPGINKRWNARALDVMPRRDKLGNVNSAAKKENADIARQIIKDRDAGHPGVVWIKYINWTDEHGNCYHEAWQDLRNPNKRTTTSSSDRNHIHISGRSDMDSYEEAEDYDPVARSVLGMGDEDMTEEQWQALKRIERLLTATFTRLSETRGAGETGDRKGIIINPWQGGPTEVPSLIEWLAAQFDAVKGAQPQVQEIDYDKLAAALLRQIAKETTP